MPLGTDNSNNHEKTLPKGLLNKILEVFEVKMPEETEIKNTGKLSKRNSKALKKEREEIARRLKAVQSVWDDNDEQGDENWKD